MGFGQNESVHRVLRSILSEERPGRPYREFLFSIFWSFLVIAWVRALSVYKSSLVPTMVTASLSFSLMESSLFLLTKGDHKWLRVTLNGLVRGPSLKGIAIQCDYNTGFKLHFNQGIWRMKERNVVPTIKYHHREMSIWYQLFH